MFIWNPLSSHMLITLKRFIMMWCTIIVLLLYNYYASYKNSWCTQFDGKLNVCMYRLHAPTHCEWSKIISSHQKMLTYFHEYKFFIYILIKISFILCVFILWTHIHYYFEKVVNNQPITGGVASVTTYFPPSISIYVVYIIIKRRYV